MADALDFGLGDSHYVFTDRELNELLGVIEQKAAGAEPELDVLDFFRTEGKEPLALQVRSKERLTQASFRDRRPRTCQLSASFFFPTRFLQFQPRSHKEDTLEQSVAAVKQEDLPVSALSSALASPVDTPALQQSSIDQPFFSNNNNSAAEISILPMPTAAPQLQAFTLPGTMVGAAATPFLSALVAPPPGPTQAQLAQAQPLAQLLPVAASPLHLARLSSAAVNSKGARKCAAVRRGRDGPTRRP
jgi:hypothetical protein